MKNITIGISIAAAPGAHIWNSGLDQNIAFLAQLLSKVPCVGKVYLLSGGAADTLPPDLGFSALNLALVRPQDVTYELDLVVEVGASLPLEWLRHIRALGTRIVTLFVGHTYAGQLEPPIFGQPAHGAFVGTPWHEIWTLPHHMKSSAPLLRTLGRVPVVAVPHIWAPVFLDTHIAELTQQGHAFGFVPKSGGTTGWRVAIFEPNISVVKSSFIPMLVCEHAYRQRRESIDLMMVMNTFFMKEHLTFNRFASHLDLTRDSKASYEPRVAFAECMAAHKMDAVVTHQWECGLNYAYYDALYGGYPLVHNSPFLHEAGVGLYYPEFEATAGGAALLAAWSAELGFWDDYRRHASAYLRGLAPDHPANIQAYAERIALLMQGCAV